jgi:hypothetical protein
MSYGIADYVTAARLVLVAGVAVDVAETITHWQHYGKRGLFSGRVFRTAFDGVLNPATGLIRALICSDAGPGALIALRSLGVVLVVIPGAPQFIATTGVALLLASSVLFGYRCPYGRDGADQMEQVVAGGLFAALLFHGRPAAAYGLWFIALESVLSYVAAGIAKAVSPVWRSGDAFFRIFNTHAYGSMALASIARDHRLLGLLVCWGTIIFECGFAVILLLPLPFMFAMLCVGALFHAVTAIIMGLNKFVWSWIATYPALLFCTHQVIAWRATIGH